MGKDLTNAKEELLRLLKNKAPMKCALINGNRLKLNYTEIDLVEFLQKMDFDYDSGYGAQELSGTIWLQDGTWCTRGEYDGSEWWNHNKLPEVPKELYKSF